MFVAVANICGESGMAKRRKRDTKRDAELKAMLAEMDAASRVLDTVEVSELELTGI